MKLQAFLILFLVLSTSIDTSGSVYYFDAAGGNDVHTQNSIETPWQSLEKLNSLTFTPGDSILLKAGSAWQGQILLQGSGTKDQVIFLGTYGTGDRPLIDGNESVGGVITLEDISHWKISGLEITNPSTTQESRIGVLITATGGQQENIMIDDLYIHDIFGRYTFEMIGKNTGGIGVIMNEEAKFDGITIQNCSLENIVRVGIFSSGTRGTRGNRPITNFIIRNNTLIRCAGDGMIIRGAERPLIEHNLAIENHNASEDLVKYGVAIWVRSTDEAVIQYNRVFDTKGSMDGQAFDADLDAYRTVVQYNYTANNEGGFMLVYGSSSDAIVRFNISQNDGVKGKHLLDFPIWTTPRGDGIIHNNVFYIGEGNDAVVIDEALPTTKFYNNIVINDGGGRLVVKSDGQTAIFRNNALYGYNESDLALDRNGISEDPEMVDPGTGGEEFTSLQGYKLSPGSPCISAGLAHSMMSGDYWFEEEMKDFWGHAVDPEALHIGADQSLEAGLEDSEGASNQPFPSWEVYPVPYNEDLYLSVNLDRSMHVKVTLLDVAGRKNTSMYSGELLAGTNKIQLNTARAFGGSDKPGIYFLQLNIPEIAVSDTRMIIRREPEQQLLP